MSQQHITVVVRVRPLDVDPSVTKDESETDNIMMIDDTHIGFLPNLSDKLNHINQLKRLASSLATFVKDSLPTHAKSGTLSRSVSPRGTLKRGVFANWPTFVYDSCFGPRECFDAYARTFATGACTMRTSQEDVFETIGRPATQTVMGGYHCCILAYGQTGSGKTYSMLGPCNVEGGAQPRYTITPKRSVTPLRNEPSFIGFTKRPTSTTREDISQIHSLKSHPHRGLIVRITEAILEDMCLRGARDSTFCFQIGCSYYQIYKEKAWDLLIERGKGTASEAAPLRLRMNERLDPYLEGLTERGVKSVDNMLSILDLGIRNRRVASTQHNVQSSRSHAILTINIAFGTPKETFHSKLYLVDLAGSERIGSLISGDREHNKTSSAVLLSSRNRGVTRQLLKPDEQQWQEAAAAQIAEASDINSSLSALGKVINVLADMRMNKNRNIHIPYRDSLLTMVLKSCFGGNAKTFMLATVSPYLRDAEESLSTLRFSSRAKLIVNRPVKNSQKARLAEIEGLRTENEQLKRQVEELEKLLRTSSGKADDLSRSRSGTVWNVPESSVARSVRSPLRHQPASTFISVGTSPLRAAVEEHHRQMKTPPPQPNLSYAQKAPVMVERSIVEGDVFRAKRLLADRLETSQLYLQRLVDEEARIHRLLTAPPSNGRVPQKLVMSTNSHHWDPCDEVVDSPDCLEELEINSLTSGEGKRYRYEPTTSSIRQLREYSRIQASAQRTLLSSPTHMNTTQPPVSPSGLIASRPPTPSGTLYGSYQRQIHPSNDNRESSSEKHDTEQHRAKREKKALRKKKEKETKESRRKRSISSSSSSDNDPQDALILQLVRQLEAVTRSQSPSARNPATLRTSLDLANIAKSNPILSTFNQQCTAEWVDATSTQSSATQALSASMPMVAIPPPKLRAPASQKPSAPETTRRW